MGVQSIDNEKIYLTSGLLRCEFTLAGIGAFRINVVAFFFRAIMVGGREVFLLIHLLTLTGVQADETEGSSFVDDTTMDDEGWDVDYTVNRPTPLFVIIIGGLRWDYLITDILLVAKPGYHIHIE